MIVKKKLEELKKKLIVVKGNDEMSTEAQRNAIRLFTIALNYNLSCKRIIEKERISSKAFDVILG